jgi:hypothetical protein
VLISPPDQCAVARGGRSVSGHGRVVTIARAVRVFSGHNLVVAGAGEAPVPCLLGEGRSILPSPSEAMWNSSVESSVMAHSGDGGPPWVEPMTMVRNQVLSSLV